MECQLEILLSTYNGEQFLSEQMNSLLAQTYTDWRLLIRDDGSTDGTLAIINKYILDFPEKISLLEDEDGNLGPTQSFAKLLYQSKASYIALCDQDDYWVPEKLKLQMDKMFYEEARVDVNYPLLINTDLKVCDEQLNILSESFWKFQNINIGQKSELRRLLVQNHVTGCTCLMNRALVDRVLPVSDRAVMHDWWLALVAVSNGMVVNVDMATVLYRQHARNKVGAKKWGFIYILNNVFSSVKYKRSLLKTRDQAKGLLNSGALLNKDIGVVQRYVNLFEQGWLKRRINMLRCGYFKFGLTRNIAMLLLL